MCSLVSYFFNKAVLQNYLLLLLLLVAIYGLFYKPTLSEDTLLHRQL